jgi:hypothetical protein
VWSGSAYNEADNVVSSEVLVVVSTVNQHPPVHPLLDERELHCIIMWFPHIGKPILVKKDVLLLLYMAKNRVGKIEDY